VAGSTVGEQAPSRKEPASGRSRSVVGAGLEVLPSVLRESLSISENRVAVYFRPGDVFNHVKCCRSILANEDRGGSTIFIEASNIVIGLLNDGRFRTKPRLSAKSNADEHCAPCLEINSSSTNGVPQTTCYASQALSSTPFA
jgi:hypothetical protein